LLLKNNFPEKKFIEYKSILKTLKLSDYQDRISGTEFIRTKTDIKHLLQVVLNTDEKTIAMSYRYTNDKYFLLVFYVKDTAYVISDEYFQSKAAFLQHLVKKIFLSDKCPQCFVWNLRHFIKPLLSITTIEEKLKIVNKFYDVKIIDHLVNLKKDPQLLHELTKDEYDKIIDVFINKIHKDDKFYYYIPRHILTRSLLKETLAVTVLGESLGLVLTKLFQTTLLKRLQIFSVFLSDLDNESLDYTLERIETEDDGFKDSFFSRVKRFAEETNNKPIQLKYKFLNSTTGRLSFNNQQKINMMAAPKTVRDMFIPDNDLFMSLDIRGMEVFYMIKTYSNILDDVEITSEFDVYQYLIDKIGGEYSRKLMKNTVIKWFYGSANFSPEEILIKVELQNKLPDISPIINKIPKYIQTKFGRVIAVNNKRSNFLNNIPQSECNDRMIDLITRLWFEFKRRNLKSHIKLLIHDQIVFDVVETEQETVKQIIESAEKFFPYKLTYGKNLQEI
jgi:hypothetical protein